MKKIVLAILSFVTGVWGCSTRSAPGAPPVDRLRGGPMQSEADEHNAMLLRRCADNIRLSRLERAVERLAEYFVGEAGVPVEEAVIRARDFWAIVGREWDDQPDQDALVAEGHRLLDSVERNGVSLLRALEMSAENITLRQKLQAVEKELADVLKPNGFAKVAGFPNAKEAIAYAWEARLLLADAEARVLVLEAILRESVATHRMWADVAPAVSLVKDIDEVLAGKRRYGEPEPFVTTRVRDPEFPQKDEGVLFQLQEWERLAKLPPGTSLYLRPFHPCQHVMVAVPVEPGSATSPCRPVCAKCGEGQ